MRVAPGPMGWDGGVGTSRNDDVPSGAFLVM